MLVILALSTVSAKTDPKPDENGFTEPKLKKGETNPDAVVSDDSNTD